MVKLNLLNLEINNINIKYKYYNLEMVKLEIILK